VTPGSSHSFEREINQEFRICLFIWAASTSASITITDPDSQTIYSDSETTDGSGLTEFFYSLLTDAATGDYVATIDQVGKTSATVTITLVTATTARIVARPSTAEVGDEVTISLTGLTPSTSEQIHFYRACSSTGLPNCTPTDPVTTEWAYVGSTTAIQLDSSGNALVTMDVDASDPIGSYQIVVVDTNNDPLIDIVFKTIAAVP
jgi:hypothetical protein